MKDEKKILSLSALAILTLIVAVVGATYAYFQAQIGANAQVTANVTTATTDSLIFSVGNAISFSANQTNFAQGAGNLDGTTTATASLKANSGNNSATYNYDLALNITDNDFIYTTEDNTAELLLTVTDPANNALTTITGLTYKTVGTVSGFDITGKTGTITIADNYIISSASSTTATTQTWTVKVTFVNLESDQQGNTGKTFSGTLSIAQS